MPSIDSTTSRLRARVCGLHARAWWIWLAMAVVASPAIARNDWPAMYILNRKLSFYIVNDLPQDFDVTIRWQNSYQNTMDTPVMVRVFDPDENLLTRYISPGTKVSGTPTWTEFTIPVTGSAAAGVYQVIVTGIGGMVHFQTEPKMSWGVYGYPYLQGSGHITDAYVYLPPNLTTLGVQCTGTVGYLRLTDSNDVTHLNISGTNSGGGCALPPGQDQVWRLTASAPGEFGVSFGVAPIIVCPDEATALAIHASVDVLDDGTICYHKFQIQAHELLAQYAAMDPAAFDVALPSFDVETPHWISDPAKNQLLLNWYGVYSNLAPVLAEQNLDPESPWFGCIREWHDANGDERPSHPWNTYDRLGLTDPAPGIAVMAAVHSINEPSNSLHHDVKLRNRISIAALRQAMMLREHELPEPTWIGYDGGSKAFNFAHFTRAYPWAVQQCAGDVQAVWTAAMRRYVDHMTLAIVPEIANQWAFIMMGLQNFAKGTGEQSARDGVQMHINWMLTRRQRGYGAMQAGYFSDGEGPDASYSGINMHMLAWLSENAQSQPLKEAVKDAFALFNHTIAPEPDGTWLGASSFSHRTPWDWANRQWTAGVGIMADESQDAAALLGRSWMPQRPPRNAAELAAQQAGMAHLLTYAPVDAYDHPNIGPCITEGPIIAMTIYEHFMGTPLTGQLPMKASSRFTRKFGSEFLAVRKPSYYAFLYSGRTYESYRQPGAPTNPDVQYPRNGGGLSMLWSPRFGTSILGENWSAFSTNSIIAQKAGQAYFEDYWQTTSGMQESHGRATINGKLTDGKMTFRRQISFQEDRIQCEIRLQPQGSVNYGRLWECFPYPLDKPDPIEVDLYDAQGKKINGNNKSASAIVFRNTANEVHIIAFSDPRICEVGSHTSTDAYNGQQQTGRVLTRLPTEWNPNQVRTVKWTARVVKPNQITATIKQMVAAM